MTVTLSKSCCEEGSGGVNVEGIDFKKRASEASTELDEDDLVLHSLGYKPQLHRGLGLVKNFAFGFTEVAVLPSIFLVFSLGLSSGGPSVLIWGWIVTFIVTLVISVCMAEICSAYPSAGCVYHWTGQLVPREKVPLFSYICGWLNFAGNCAGDASFANGFAQYLSLGLTVSGKDPLDASQQVGVSIAVMVIWSLLNCFRIDQVGWINQMAAVFHICSIIIIVVATLSLPPTESTWNEFLSTAYNNTMTVANFATGEEVFTAYYNGTGFDSKSYACVIGITAACFGFSGYEASGHIAEETHGASKTAPLGIIFTVLATGIGGLALLLALLFVTPTVDDYLVAGGLTGNAAVEVLTLAAGPAWTEAMLWLVFVNFFFAGLSSVAITGRITFAMSRDKGFPSSDLLSTVHPTFKSPVYSIMFVCFIDALLLLLPLDTTSNGGGNIAFYSIVGLTAIGFQVSYAFPILMKLIYQPKDFPVTDMNLGRWSTPLGCLAVTWLLGTSCLFFLPSSGPTVDETNMNWLVVVVGGFFFFGAINWIFNSRYYFTGPARVNTERMNLLASTKYESVSINGTSGKEGNGNNSNSDGNGDGNDIGIQMVTDHPSHA